eukprot:Unigene720_Nuclearia_a/m.2323 Unigene720_Nuclearia_a/g.2323  ORF Unigene720_Nuclearia_a/g.2323 Unigene720_Nuclearia_a/m.2323 type:complete len:133 (-) Unigene720_Nuclearia_a:925-1323(-)
MDVDKPRDRPLRLLVAAGLLRLVGLVWPRGQLAVDTPLEEAAAMIIIPCGTVIGNKWEDYISLMQNDYSEKEALDALGLERYCCRRMILTHVDLIERLLQYNGASRAVARPRCSRASPASCPRRTRSTRSPD